MRAVFPYIQRSKIRFFSAAHKVERTVAQFSASGAVLTHWSVSPHSLAITPKTLSDSAKDGDELRPKSPTLWLLPAVFRFILPADYPRSVAPEYFAYASWATGGAIASSAAGVLSMHALLFAVGVGSGAAAPLAAAANWVLKDGLGQLGGVAFAAFINTRFDADPKRWRWLSAVALDLSTLIEICTPLFPGLFLPLAALANVGKNIAWLSASATRAGVHQALALHGNLADVTGKGLCRGYHLQCNAPPTMYAEYPMLCSWLAVDRCINARDGFRSPPRPVGGPWDARYTAIFPLSVCDPFILCAS